jgi:hypothetical protein
MANTGSINVAGTGQGNVKYWTQIRVGSKQADREVFSSYSPLF